MPDDGRSSGKMFLPKGVTNERHGRTAGLTFVSRKCATEHRFHSQCRQIIHHDSGASDAFRFAIPRQIERAFPANAAADKGMTSVSIRRELQERRSEGVESFSQRDAKDESVDIFNRQWTEQERVNGAEDRRGRADAESQRRNRNRAERGLLKQNPRTVTEVVP